MAEPRPGRRPRVISVVGTRPEAIKMAPVVRALSARDAFDQQLVLTGQHRGLARRFRAVPRVSIHQLGINPVEQTAGEISESVHYSLCDHLLHYQPDLVLVQGDTSSALGGALAARDCGIPVGHVEAGLRSFDLQQPWPEEINRVEIDAMSDLLFAPTALAAQNLAAEPQVRGKVLVTGNSGIDALLDARATLPSLGDAAAERRMILVTCHRRENWGLRLERIADALERLGRELPVEIVFALHTNRRLRNQIALLLAGKPNIRLVEPLRYEQMVAMIERCWLILTDSGGLQEEGPALGKPVLVLRDVTERSEAIETDNVELVGTDPDRIFDRVRALIDDETVYARMARPAFPFGDGTAGPRIATAVEEFLIGRRPVASG